MLSASSFVVIALVLCMAAVLALFGVTHVSMSGAEAIERDGLAPGMHAPVWSLADSTGNVVRSPPRTPVSRRGCVGGVALASFVWRHRPLAQGRRLAPRGSVPAWRSTTRLRVIAGRRWVARPSRPCSGRATLIVLHAGSLGPRRATNYFP